MEQERPRRKINQKPTSRVLPQNHPLRTHRLQHLVLPVNSGVPTQHQNTTRPKIHREHPQPQQKTLRNESQNQCLTIPTEQQTDLKKARVHSVTLREHIQLAPQHPQKEQKIEQQREQILKSQQI